MSDQIILRLLITLLILDLSSARPLWSWFYYDDYPSQEYLLDHDDDRYVIQKRQETINVETDLTYNSIDIEKEFSFNVLKNRFGK